MNDSNRTLSSADLVRLVRDHRILVVGTTVLFLVVAVVASYLVTPIYRAEVLLAPVLLEGEGIASSRASQYLDLAGLGGVTASTQERAQLLAALTSRSFTYEFIRAEHVSPVLFSDRWDERKGEWVESVLSDTPTTWQAYQRFDAGIRSVRTDEDSGLITVSIEWPDPEIAASWANSLVERVNEHLRMQAIDEGERSMEYLSRELRNTNTEEVRDAIYGLMEAQLRKVMLANVREEFGFRVLDSAVPPEVNERPNRRVMALAGTLLGFCVGVLAAAWRERGRAAVD